MLQTFYPDAHHADSMDKERYLPTEQIWQPAAYGPALKANTLQVTPGGI